MIRPLRCSIRPRIPRQVEMEQVGAVVLEIESLAGGIGRDQYAQRIVRGIGVESLLDFLRRPAVAALQESSAVGRPNASPKPLP